MPTILFKVSRIRMIRVSVIRGLKCREVGRFIHLKLCRGLSLLFTQVKNNALP